MWEDTLNKLSKKCQLEKFDSVKELDLKGLEDKLKVGLPSELKDLLKLSNGLEINRTMLVRSVKDIEGDNEELRSNERIINSFMSFDSLFFFGVAGNGNLFAYGIIKGEIKKTDIFAWDHENDSRTWVAPSLTKLLEWWVEGKITV